MFRKDAKYDLLVAVGMVVILLVLLTISGQAVLVWGFLIPGLSVFFSIDFRKITKRWIHQATVADQARVGERVTKETWLASFVYGQVQQFTSAPWPSRQVTRTVYEAESWKQRIEVTKTLLGTYKKIKVWGPKANILTFSVVWGDEVYRDSDGAFVGCFRGKNADLLLICQAVASLDDSDFPRIDFTECYVSDLLVKLLQDAMR